MNDSDFKPDDKIDSADNDKQPARLNPELIRVEMNKGTRPGDNYVRVITQRMFRRAGQGFFIATPEADIPRSKFQRIVFKIKRIFIGKPLPTAEESNQNLNIFKNYLFIYLNNKLL